MEQILDRGTLASPNKNPSGELVDLSILDNFPMLSFLF
jgi:hypothetical protein